VFLVNSRLSRFAAAPSPGLYETKLLGHPFFRRYGVVLPSSLTEVRSFTWGEFSLPTCVGLRYGQKDIWLGAFLGGVGIDDSASFRKLVPTVMLGRPGFVSVSHFRLGAHPVHLMGSPTLPRPLITHLMFSGAGFSDLLSIAYDCYVLGLGPD
jgi:hypothetical protein